MHLANVLHEHTALVELDHYRSASLGPKGVRLARDFLLLSLLRARVQRVIGSVQLRCKNPKIISYFQKQVVEESQKLRNVYDSCQNNSNVMN